MFLTQCRQVPKHHEEWLDGLFQTISWISWFDIMDILVDENFDEGSMELKLYPQDDSDDENIDD